MSALVWYWYLARMASGMKDVPVDAAIVGVIDAVDVNES